MRFVKFIGLATAAVLTVCAIAPVSVNAEYVSAGSECAPAHDTSRDVQAEGVGNPFNYGERNTPADASTAEIRAINHAMSVQEVKYALYKEIDEHWDLITVRLGQPDREKVYALFLGLGTRESTLGGNGDGADLETAFEKGFGVDPAHAYGTMQTAVTAFADCDPTFVKEDNVPEMYQYTFNESNFYDAIISDHMGIRKIMHFVGMCINDYGQSGYAVVRNSLKGFNTGWSYQAEGDGAYTTYADEICALAQWYYNEGHLYDNVFTWTNSSGADPYRVSNCWDWWGDGQPSMAEINSDEPTTVTTAPDTEIIYGDANDDREVSVADPTLIMQAAANPNGFTVTNIKAADVTGSGDGVTSGDALVIQKFLAGTITALPVD